ncbi:MAG: hypothetical protein K1X91_04970 [Bacteriodetes bacterium]|nr:hypothetical protein [Bacteroidota bacterium]
MLPSKVHCYNCNNELELDFNERKNHSYVCPVCKSGWLDPKQNTTLEEQVSCGKCNSMIELSEQERNNVSFTCPVCSTPWATNKQNAMPIVSNAQTVNTQEEANSMITKGLLFLVGGILITGITYASASEGGGTYFVMYGPIIYGVITLVRGLSMKSNS